MNQQVLLVTIIGFILQNVQGQLNWMNNMRGMRNLNPAMSLGLSGLQTFGAATTNSGMPSSMNLGSTASSSQTMMTCVGKQVASTGGQNVIAVTIRQVTINNNNNNMFSLFNARPMSELRADVSITSRDIDGMFSLVVTERARDESTCTTDGMGELVASASGSGNNLARQLGGMFPMAAQFTAQLNSERSNGILRDVDIRPGEKKDLSISATSLPYNNVRNFAGHGIALCGVVTPVGDIMVNTNQFGFPIGNIQQMATASVCEGEIPLCCKLGYDNTEAMPF